ncbi:hypothetical protein D3C87_2179510 [compost metagenome]
MTVAVGPSAQGNHSISIGAAGGMVFGVILGLLLIPVLFVIFQHLQERISGKSVIPEQQTHTVVKVDSEIIYS